MNSLYIVIGIMVVASLAVNYKHLMLVVGTVFSGLVFFGIFVFGEMLSHQPKPPVVKEELPKIEVFDMPQIKPETEEVVDPTQQQAPPQDFAPPMQQDVPQMTTDTTFIQQLQPPPPQNVQVNRSAIIIPQNTGNWAKGIGQIFDISKLDQIPEAISRPPPQYPFEMRRAGISGQVVVMFIVDANGDVRNAYAASSTQHDFEQNAVAAVAKWKFKPGRKNGRNVNSYMQVPIVFSLNSEE
jgi:protein TonB